MTQGYKLKGLHTVALLTIFFIFSCTTNPKDPLWLVNPPESGDTVTFFIAAGESAVNNEEEAVSLAKEMVIEEITSRLALEVDPDTPIEARTAYNNFRSQILMFLSEEPSGFSGKICVRESFVQYDHEVLRVYLLVEWDNSYMESEKKQLEKLFQKQKVGLFIKEKEGDKCSECGDYYAAALSYIDAALFFSKSDDKESELSFRRNISKAVDCIGRIDMQMVSGPSSAYIGEDLAEDFIVRLLSCDKGIPNIQISVSYKILKLNGRKSTETQLLSTNEDGYAYFRPKVPGWVGKEKVIFSLDLSTVLKSLEDVSFELLQYVDILAQAVASCRTSFGLDVQSRAVEIPTCVMVMDVDRSGNPLSRTDTAYAVTGALGAAGFDVYQLSVDYRMTALSDSELIALIREQYGNRYQRLVFGTAEISSFEESETSVIVKVTGKLKVVELDSGKILFSASEQKRARGPNNTVIISAAFTSLGKLFGERLLSDLP